MRSTPKEPKAEQSWFFRSTGGQSPWIADGTVLPDAPEQLREAALRGRRRPPGWVLQLLGLSLGGLVAGIAIGFRLPA